MKKTSFIVVFAAIALMGYAQKNSYTIKGKVDDAVLALPISMPRLDARR